MYFNRFQQGDSVQYAGEKDSLKSKLSGKEGFIVARVQGDEREVCVAFGDDAYILDEQSDLERFVKRHKPEASAEDKGPVVQKRRGVSGEDGGGRKGKRRKGGAEE